uniref:Uncharacterized protein n=1 Tax=Glossina palpalis gambiensis TaxID=67801 RepID=A0A1B0C4M2_9MUSC
MAKTPVYVVYCGFVVLFIFGFFEKSGRRSHVCYPDFAKEAVTKALSDVKIPYTEVQQAAVGGAAVVRLYRLGFPASVNIKSNLISAASATIEGFKVTPLLKLLEQAMMKDQENLIEELVRDSCTVFKKISVPSSSIASPNIEANSSVFKTMTE